LTQTIPKNKSSAKLETLAQLCNIATWMEMKKKCRFQMNKYPFKNYVKGETFCFFIISLFYFFVLLSFGE